jgi:hypothetical protein
LPEVSQPSEISVDVSTDEHLILVKLSGRPEADSIVLMLDQIDALVAHDVSLRILIDETELRPSFVGPGDIGRFVAAWKRGAALRAATLAVFTPNLAMYGLNRMFQLLADEEDRVRVFHNRADAMAWLSGSSGSG